MHLRKSIRDIFWLALFMGVFYAAMSPAIAATYYVDGNNGCDWNGGTFPTDAWQSIGRADRDQVGVMESLKAGDVVLFEPGTYTVGENGGDVRYAHGEPGNPITYKANGAVKLIAASTPAFRLFGSSVNNIIIEGFEIVGSYAGVELAEGADNITVRWCYIHDIDAPHPGTYSQCRGIDITSGGSDGCIINNNIIGDLGEDPLPGWSVGLDGATNTTIINNTLVNALAGLAQFTGSGTTFKNNIITDMSDSAIQVQSGATSITQSHNLYFNASPYCNDTTISLQHNSRPFSLVDDRIIRQTGAVIERRNGGCPGWYRVSSGMNDHYISRFQYV